MKDIFLTPNKRSLSAYPSSTWQCPRSYIHISYGVFEERKRNFFASTPDLAHVISFCFRTWNHSFLGGNTSPDRHLDLSFSVPWRYIGWNISRHWEYFEGMKWSLLGLLKIWSPQIEISNTFRTTLVYYTTIFYNDKNHLALLKLVFQKTWMIR